MSKVCANCGNELNISITLGPHKYSCPKCGARKYDYQIKEQ